MKRLPPPVDPDPTPDELATEGVLDLEAAAEFLSHGVTWLKDEIAAGRIPELEPRLGKKRLVPKRFLQNMIAARLKG